MRSTIEPFCRTLPRDTWIVLPGKLAVSDRYPTTWLKIVLLPQLGCPTTPGSCALHAELFTHAHTKMSKGAGAAPRPWGTSTTSSHLRCGARSRRIMGSLATAVVSVLDGTAHRIN